MKTGKESSQASVGQISAAEIGTSRANVAPSLATDIAVQINKARDELYLGHVLEVISRMERIVSSDSPGLTPFAPALMGSALSLLARAYRRNADEARALETFQRALPLLDPAADLTAQQWTDRGIVLSATGRAEEAIEALETARKKQTEPTSEVVGILGGLLAEAGRLDEAEAALRQAVSLDPGDYMFQLNLGWVMQALGKPDVEPFERAIDVLAPTTEFGALAAAINGLLEVDPTSVRAYATRGELLRRTGDVDGSIQALEKALELEPENAYAEASLGAALATDPERLEEALKHLDRALARDADYVFTQYWRATVLRSMQRFSDAIGAADEALARTPDDADFLILKGLALRDLDQHEASLAPLRRALEINPGDGDTMVILGEALEMIDHLEEAKGQYERALATVPGHPLALALLARTFLSQGRPEEAVAPLIDSIRKEPEDWKLDLLGTAILESGRHEQALEQVNAILRGEPGEPGMLTLKARLLYREGKLEEALETLDPVLSADPTVVVCILYSDILRDLGKMDESLKLADRAMELEPQNAAAVGTRGQALHALGRHDEALAELDRALVLNDQFAWLHAERGDTLQDLGRFDDASDAYTAGLLIEPTNEGMLFASAAVLRPRRKLGEAETQLKELIERDVATNRARSELAEVYYATGRYAEAIEEIQRLLKSEPEHQRAKELRAQSLVAAGRYDDGLVALDEVLKVTPDFAWGHFLRGMALNGLNRLTDALAAMATAREKGVDEPNYWLELASIHTSSGETQEATQAVDRVDRESVKDWDPLSRAWAASVRGVAYWYAGRWAESEESLEAAVEADPKAIAMRIWLAEAKRQTSGPVDADALLRETIASVSDPRHAKATDMASIGWAHRLLKEWERAADLLIRALSKDPSLQWAQFDFALTLMGKGAYGAGMSEYERGVEQVQSLPDPRRQFGILSVALQDFNEILPPAADEPGEVKQARELLTGEVNRAREERDTSGRAGKSQAAPAAT